MARQLALDSGALIGEEVGYMRSVIIISLIEQISEEATVCLGHTLRLGKSNTDKSHNVTQTALSASS